MKENIVQRMTAFAIISKSLSQSHPANQRVWGQSWLLYLDSRTALFSSFKMFTVDYTLANLTNGCRICHYEHAHLYIFFCKFHCCTDHELLWQLLFLLTAFGTQVTFLTTVLETTGVQITGSPLMLMSKRVHDRYPFGLSMLVLKSSLTYLNLVCFKFFFTRV